MATQCGNTLAKTANFNISFRYFAESFNYFNYY